MSPFKTVPLPPKSARLLVGAAMLLLTVAQGHGLTMLVDLNTSNGSGGPGGSWNFYADPTDINGSTLVDITGTTTTVTLSRTGSTNQNDGTAATQIFNPNTAPIGLPSWATATDNNGASGDNFFTSNAIGIQTFTLTFGGLTVGDTFSLDLLASRNSGLARGFYEYSLNGGTTWNGFTVLNGDGTLATGAWSGANTKDKEFLNSTDGFSAHRYMNVSNVTLTGATLAVRVTDSVADDTYFAALNALRLITVPEPSVATLGLVGVAAVVLRRRRQA